MCCALLRAESSVDDPHETTAHEVEGFDAIEGAIGEDPLANRLNVIEKRLADLEKAVRNRQDLFQGIQKQQETAAQAEDAYNAALRLMKEGFLAQADAAFSQFFEQYSTSPLRSTAFYWLGILALLRFEYPKALSIFNLFLRDWPNHEKVSDARLKKVYCYQAMAEPRRACVALQDFKKHLAGDKQLSTSKSAQMQKSASKLWAQLRCAP